MKFRLFLAICAGKITGFLSSIFGMGKGSSAPGKIALWIYSDLIEYYSKQIKKKKIMVSATNGKTTTSNMIAKIISSKSDKIVTNSMGANLDTGIATSFVNISNLSGKIDIDYGVFEVDEAVMPLVLDKIRPDIILLANLFRDQLDRYGEIDTLAKKWLLSLKNYKKKANIVLNVDDPVMQYIANELGNKAKVYYAIGELKKTSKTELEHAADSNRCLYCGNLLEYKNKIFSHLGDYRCKKCSFKKQRADFLAIDINKNIDRLSFNVKTDSKIEKIKLNFGGVYNVYNALGACAVGKLLDIENKIICKKLLNFKPAFGRMEEFEYKGKKFRIILIKNPTGANVVIDTLRDIKNKNMMISLNDNIADGTDVSWIWDVDFEQMGSVNKLYCLGKRKYDLAIRMKYAGFVKDIEISEKGYIKILDEMVDNIKDNQYGYLLPTYTAMLEMRKELERKNIVKKI